MVNVLIKNVDETAYKNAKLLAVKNDKNVGQVVSEALMLLARFEEKRGLAAVKPVDFGAGTKDLSLKVDEILYGE